MDVSSECVCGRGGGEVIFGSLMSLSFVITLWEKSRNIEFSLSLLKTERNSKRFLLFKNAHFQQSISKYYFSKAIKVARLLTSWMRTFLLRFLDLSFRVGLKSLSRIPYIFLVEEIVADFIINKFFFLTLFVSHKAQKV